MNPILHSLVTFSFRAAYKLHGWMAVSKFPLVVLLFAVTVVLAEEQPGAEQPKKMFYDLDKTKLHGVWYLGAVRGLIKMKARASLGDTSWIERTVYNQCEQNAKSTVDLAKCAVRVFDARDNEPVPIQTTEKPPQKPIVNISVRKSQYKPIEPTVTFYSTQQNLKTMPKTRKNYYFKQGFGWVKNPVRSQTRRRRLRRDMKDDLDLLEEKRLENEEANESNDPMMDISELKRLLGKKESKRTKWKRETTGSTMAVDYSKLAMEYLKNFVGKSDGVSNLVKLRKIKDFADKSDKVKAYYKLMNDENKLLMRKYGIQSEDPQVEKDATDVLLDVVNAINDFAGKKFASKISIASPRLFSLMPDNRPATRLFSPTVFSFQEDGFFSLPGLLDILVSNKKSQQAMLDMLLDVSGASIALDQAMNSLNKEMEDLDNIHYPLLQKMSRHDHNWIRAKRSFSDEQQEEYEKYGFTYLNKEQMDLMYANKELTHSWGMNSTQFASMSREEKDRMVEQQIREIALIGRPKWPLWGPVRHRRQAGEPAAPAFEGVTNDEHTGIENNALQPIAFTNFVNEGIALELVTLSPRAFISEILAPEALTLHTLSPRAFVATILSPSALMARILTPGVLRAEVLSPRALQAWVLSPEALIAEVLTPHFLEPRVLSPEALVIFVLSPKILSPYILSGEALGVVVLSPNILSPRIVSEENMLVEVLSPHILGGAHSHEEAHHEVLEVGSHSEHSDEGHPHEHTEGHDEHGHAILQPRIRPLELPTIAPLQLPTLAPPAGQDAVSQFFRSLG